MKSSDLLTEALHVPLLAMTSSAGVLVLACYFTALWLALLTAMLVVFFMRSAWRRARWMTWTTMQGPQHERTEEGRTHSLPWILGACFGLRLFAQPSECDAGQSRGASGVPSRVADVVARAASSLGQRLPHVSTGQTHSGREYSGGDHRGPHDIDEDVDGSANLEPVHGSLHSDLGENRAAKPPNTACARVTGEQRGATHEGRVLHEEHHHDDGSEHRTSDAKEEDEAQRRVPIKVGPEPNVEHGADDTRRTA